MVRRRFVWASLFAFFGACLAGTVRFFYPRALFEPKTRFVIGYPSDFSVGVSTKFQQSNRVWVVRDSSSI
jgi:cytochrome b6-f complex iron-sulfur subunit